MDIYYVTDAASENEVKITADSPQGAIDQYLPLRAVDYAVDEEEAARMLAAEETVDVIVRDAAEEEVTRRTVRYT